MTKQELFNLADDYRAKHAVTPILNIMADEKVLLTEEILKDFHRILGGDGTYRSTELMGSELINGTVEAAELKRLMKHFISQLQISKQMFHPIEYAAICHKRVLELCPFEDKNDEVAFLVLNALLTQVGYSPIGIGKQEKSTYIRVLQGAKHPSHPDLDSYLIFILECEVKAQKVHLESISQI